MLPLWYWSIPQATLQHSLQLATLSNNLSLPTQVFQFYLYIALTLLKWTNIRIKVAFLGSKLHYSDPEDQIWSSRCEVFFVLFCCFLFGIEKNVHLWADLEK